MSQWTSRISLPSPQRMSHPSYVTLRAFSSFYSPIIKRNKPQYVDFPTGYPKQNIPKPTIQSAFTLSKQKRINQLLEATPQTLSKSRVLRWLSVRRIKLAGRNAVGQITVRHRGGGHKQRLRLIDFKRGRKDIPATVLRIEYDPSHSAHCALIQYDDGVLSYITAPLSIRPGDKVLASIHANIAPGNALPLRHMPIGTIMHNIELRPGAGAQLNRAAGTYATLLSKDDEYATVKLKSTEIRKILLDCWATVGQVSNLERATTIWGKAGASVWRGWRPRVRGNAMVPSTHPHGGGSAKKHTKRPPVSLWGIHSQDYKTRCRTKPNKDLVLVRKNDLPKSKGYRKLNFK